MGCSRRTASSIPNLTPMVAMLGGSTILHMWSQPSSHRDRMGRMSHPKSSPWGLIHGQRLNVGRMSFHSTECKNFTYLGHRKFLCLFLCDMGHSAQKPLHPHCHDAQCLRNLPAQPSPGMLPVAQAAWLLNSLMCLMPWLYFYGTLNFK